MMSQSDKQVRASMEDHITVPSGVSSSRQKSVTPRCLSAMSTVTGGSDALAHSLQSWGERSKSREKYLGKGDGEFTALTSQQLSAITGRSAQPSPRPTSDEKSSAHFQFPTDFSEEVQAGKLTDGNRGSTLRNIRRTIQKSLYRLIFRDVDGSEQYINPMTAPSQKKRKSLKPKTFDGANDAALRKMIRNNLLFSGLNRRQAEHNARVQRLIITSGSREKAFNLVLSDCDREEEVKGMLLSLISEGVDLQATHSSEFGGPLHLAVKKGFKSVTALLCEQGVPTDWTNKHGFLAIEIAVQLLQDDAAEAVLRAMDKSLVRQLFIPGEVTKRTRINFYDMVDSSQLKKSCDAVMDILIHATDTTDQYLIYSAPLEVNSQGLTPGGEEFEWGSSTAYHLLTQDQDLKHHSVVRLLTHKKWSSFAGVSSRINIVLYGMFLVILSFSLMSAANQRASGYNSTMNTFGDPRVYDNGEAIVRAVCEIFLIISIAYTLYDEFILLTSIGLHQYWRNPYKYYHWTIVVLFIAVIPLRWLDNDTQWYIAAVLYAMACLRVLRLLGTTRFVGIYTRILIHILFSDMSRFLVLFLVFWLTFTGSFYLILVGSVRNEGGTTGTQLDITDEVGSYQAILFSSLRMMVESQPVYEYSNTGFHWLAILALLIFLFAVLVVLLNILIAQLSDTYAEVKNKAASTLEETWAHAIRTIELTSKFRRRRRQTYRTVDLVDRPQDILGSFTPPSIEDNNHTAERERKKLYTQVDQQATTLQTLHAQMLHIISLLDNKADFERRPVSPVFDEDGEEHDDELFVSETPSTSVTPVPAVPVTVEHHISQPDIDIVDLINNKLPVVIDESTSSAHPNSHTDTHQKVATLLSLQKEGKEEAVSRHIRDVIREVGETNAAIARDTQETVRREVVSEIMQQFSSATGEVVEQVTDILEETLPI